MAASLSDGALDRAAALGSAQLRRQEGGAVLTLHDDPTLSMKHRTSLVERASPDLGLELAALLLRAKYAGDHRGIRRANFLLALRLRFRAKRSVRRASKGEAIAIALASQSIAEWLADLCDKCNGTGRCDMTLGRMDERLVACKRCAASGQVGVYGPRMMQLLWAGDHDGQELRPTSITCPECRGSKIAYARTRVHQNLGSVCTRCGGTGGARPKHTDRAIAIGVSRETYLRVWSSWFDWALAHLNSLDKTLVSLLHCELGRGYDSPR